MNTESEITMKITADTSEFEKSIERCNDTLRELISLCKEFHEAANRLSDDIAKVSNEVSGVKIRVSS